MNVDRLREMLDVCRDRSDLDDPELQAAAEAVRQDPAAEEYLEASLRFDRVVAKQLQHPAAPAGFENQILAVLASAVPVDSETPELEPPELEPPELAPAARKNVTNGSASPFRWSRRSRTFALAATSLAATVLVVLAVSGTWWGSLERDKLIAMARDWPTHVVPGQWRMDLGAAPNDRPISRGVNADALGWQSCPTSFDPNTVVYKMATYRGRQHGLLFVATGAVSRLPAIPATQPADSTGNRCVGAWEANGYVYVLIVDGTASDYRRFVESPMARALPERSRPEYHLVACVTP